MPTFEWLRPRCVVLLALVCLARTLGATSQCSPPPCYWANFGGFDNEGTARIDWGYDISNGDPAYWSVFYVIDDGRWIPFSSFLSGQPQTTYIPMACAPAGQTHKFYVVCQSACQGTPAFTDPLPSSRPGVSATQTSSQNIHVTYSFVYFDAAEPLARHFVGRRAAHRARALHATRRGRVGRHHAACLLERSRPLRAGVRQARA